MAITRLSATAEEIDRMKISGITWRGESFDDPEILSELPPELAQILSVANGFILHNGALHVRGASLFPEWHSLRAAWRGASAFHALYDSVRPTDIPFSQDQLGDQFLIRDGSVLRLIAETGELESLVESVADFFSRVNEDIEAFLNVGLRHSMQPGQLMLAFPPFVLKESGGSASLKPAPACDVISFHADLARQIQDVPDGGQIVLKIKGR